LVLRTSLASPSSGAVILHFTHYPMLYFLSCTNPLQGGQMKTLSGIDRNWHHALMVALLSVTCMMAPAAIAQQATANVNGVVKDQNGAAIPNAQVELTNANTGV